MSDTQHQNVVCQEEWKMLMVRLLNEVGSLKAAADTVASEANGDEVA